MSVFREAACGKALAALWPPVTAPPAVGGKSGYFPGCCTSRPVSVKRNGPKRKTRLFLPARRKGRNSAHRRGKNRFFRLFHAGQFTGKPLQNLRLFRLKIFAAIPAVPMPARPGSPFGLMHVPEEQPYDTLIPDFRENRENSERPFLCRRISLAFPCEIISNHDSVNYD